MKRSLIVPLVFLLAIPSFSFTQDLQPSLSIRYDDFINSLDPVAAIGIILKIDDERYTGFETNSDGSDIRLLMGLNWGVIGIGSLTNANGTFPHYTFGVSYGILEGLNSNFEYVMTPSDASGVNDHLRLSLSIKF